MAAFWADVISVVHFAYVAYVVLGLLVIVAGLLAGWGFVRNFWFRITHLAMIAVVALEAMAGITCPLTTWENQLRRAAGQSVSDHSFVAQIIHNLMFFDLPDWAFRCMHIGFAVLVIATFVLAPPRWRRTASTEA